MFKTYEEWVELRSKYKGKTIQGRIGRVFGRYDPEEGVLKDLNEILKDLIAEKRSHSRHNLSRDAFAEINKIATGSKKDKYLPLLATLSNELLSEFPGQHPVADIVAMNHLIQESQQAGYQVFHAPHYLAYEIGWKPSALSEMVTAQRNIAMGMIQVVKDFGWEHDVSDQDIFEMGKYGFWQNQGAYEFLNLAEIFPDVADFAQSGASALHATTSITENYAELNAPVPKDQVFGAVADTMGSVFGVLSLALGVRDIVKAALHQRRSSRSRAMMPLLSASGQEAAAALAAGLHDFAMHELSVGVTDLASGGVSLAGAGALMGVAGFAIKTALRIQFMTEQQKQFNETEELMKANREKFKKSSFMIECFEKSPVMAAYFIQNCSTSMLSTFFDQRAETALTALRQLQPGMNAQFVCIRDLKDSAAIVQSKSPWGFPYLNGWMKDLNSTALNAPVRFMKNAGRELFVHADWTKFKSRFRSGRKKMDGFGSA